MTGARFYKADLHTHTPASHDYQEAKTSPSTLLAAAEKAGLHILAITDHNTAAWIDPLRKASKGTPITIVPGVELTTPEGHLLALFELDCPSETISDLLVQVGIPRDQHGREEAISTQHAEEVILAIGAAGGIAIAAHANENSGLLKTKGQYKIGVVPMPELAALELTKQDEIERFCAGKVSADYAPKACTHGSDSHTPAEVGRRVTYLKMDSISLRGIRQALLDYEVKVRFPWDFKDAAHPAILRLHVDQGFFADQPFAFHDGLNCLVGGKGTGKSTVIELLRYCLADTSTFPSIQEDHVGKISALVGPGGTILVELRDTDGETKTIRREVQAWETEREVRDSAGNPTTIESPPAFFSQGELVQIASTPIAQLDLLDRSLDVGEENRLEQETVEALRANAGNLVAARERLATLRAELDHPETGKVATETQHSKLERQLKNPVLTELPSWETEQAYIGGLVEGLGALPDAFDEAIETIDLEPLRASLPDDAPNKKRLRPLEGVAKTVDDLLAAVRKDFRTKTTALLATTRTMGTGLTPLFTAKKAQHRRVLEGLGQADTRKATAQYRSLGKRLEGLRQYESALGKVAKRETGFANEHKDLLERLAKCRRARWQKRAAKASEYETKLVGLVRISVAATGDKRAYAKALRELSRKGYLKEPDINQIVTTIEPSALAAHIRNGDVEEIAAAAKITREVAKRVVESCSDKESRLLYDLEVVPLPDQPEVRYVFGPGREKPLRELSTGQKGTVIIALAMAEGVSPLVIDQPEEPLDTQSIYSQVVRTLRRTKEDRQFIFTTHNPNIAVGADADLSHILDAGADKGTILSSGGVDNIETNKLLLVHLEGGRDALTLRVKKYVP